MYKINRIMTLSDNHKSAEGDNKTTKEICIKSNTNQMKIFFLDNHRTAEGDQEAFEERPTGGK